VIIAIFPVLLLIESYVNVGYFPIFSEGSITGTMYGIDYGFLYSYKLLMVFSILILLGLSQNYQSKIVKTLCLFALLAFLAISLLDGKRFIFLLIVITVVIFFVKINGVIWLKEKLVYLFFTVFLVYTGISFARSGESFFGRGFNLEHFFNSLGDEFRDYAWTMANFDPGTIANYSWFQSSLASFINGGLLKLIGVNKQELVQFDSARAWSVLFDSEMGIRTGIVSELWFAYGYFGCIVMLVLGVFTAWVSNGLRQTKNVEHFYFYAVIFALLMLLIMGQSSTFFGSLITCFYLYISLKLAHVLRIRKWKI